VDALKGKQVSNKKKKPTTELEDQIKKKIPDAVQKFFDTLPVQSWQDAKDRERRQQLENLMKQFNYEAIQNDPNQMRKWNKKLEELFQSHKADIRVKLTKYASTGPWNKVVLGQMD